MSPQSLLLPTTSITALPLAAYAELSSRAEVGCTKSPNCLLRYIALGRYIVHALHVFLYLMLITALNGRYYYPQFINEDQRIE